MRHRNPPPSNPLAGTDPSTRPGDSPIPLPSFEYPPELLLLDPAEIQAPEDRNTRRFQTSRESILSLALSLLSEGQLEPVGVIRMPDSTYLLAWGWRRWQAACLINQEQLGMGLFEGPFRLLAVLSPSTAHQPHQPAPEVLAGIAENAQRVELGPVDQALALRLLVDGGLSQRAAAAKLSLDRTVADDRLRLLELPPDLQRQVNSGIVPVSTALRILDPPEGPRRDAAAGAVREMYAPSESPISDNDDRFGGNSSKSGNEVLNESPSLKPDKPVEKAANSKTAKQMIVELTAFSTPENYDNSPGRPGRTAAQKWVLTELIPWIGRSSRPFREAGESLERLARGRQRHGGEV